MGAASVGQMQEVVPAIKNALSLESPLFAKPCLPLSVLWTTRFWVDVLKKHMVLCCLKQHLPIATTRFASSHSLHGAAIHWGALVHDSRSTAKNLVYQQIVDFHKTPTPKVEETNLLTSTKFFGFLMGVFHTFHLFSVVFIISPQVLLQPPRPWPAASAPATASGGDGTSGPSGCVGLGPPQRQQ